MDPAKQSSWACAIYSETTAMGGATFLQVNSNLGRLVIMFLHVGAQFVCTLDVG